MEFVDYRVLPDELPGHAMVVADIRFKANFNTATNPGRTIFNKY